MAPCLLGRSNDLAEVTFPTVFHIAEDDGVHWAPKESRRARYRGLVSDIPVTCDRGTSVWRCQFEKGGSQCQYTISALRKKE